MKNFILAAKGFCMGAADVVPGVSGGTMAFILGIYAQLLAAIRSFDTIWLKHIVKLEFKQVIQRPHFPFLIPLGIGILCAIIFFTRIIPLPTLLYTHADLVYGLFFGLIIGSIMTLLPEGGRFDRIFAFFISVGMALGWFVVTLVPMNTPDATWFIFLSGVLAISAMILPGISGSFILLILKKYDTILNAIGHFRLEILIPFGLGAIVGLTMFSRFLSWLLSHAYRETLITIVGVLIGSLWVIYPFQSRKYETIHGKQKLIDSTPYLPNEITQHVLLVLLMVFIGLATVFFIHWLNKRLKHT